MKKIWLTIATLGGIGFFPYFPGTIASAATIVFLWFLPALSFIGQFSFLIITFFIAYQAVARSLSLFDMDDPSCIVVDEFIGCLVTFLSIPFKVRSVLLGFLLFRFFDISKCCAINRLEKIPGALGIIFDDIAAGLVTNLILRFFLFYGML